MGITGKELKPIKYIICFKNHLDTHWEHWFEGMSISHADNGVTVLSGEVADQSALHSLLEKIHNLNLTLISFQRIDDANLDCMNKEH